MRGLTVAVLNIFLSLLLGAVALALVAINFPDWLEYLQIRAGFFKDWLLDAMNAFGSSSSINVWVRFLVQDEQLVFMGFVIVSRVVLYFILSFLASLVTGEAFRVEREFEQSQDLKAERERLAAERRELEAQRKALAAERNKSKAEPGGQASPAG